jgi:hypothetical protein
MHPGNWSFVLVELILNLRKYCLSVQYPLLFELQFSSVTNLHVKCAGGVQFALIMLIADIINFVMMKRCKPLVMKTNIVKTSSCQASV